MSSDNIQRKMDFIVEQQAKFTVDIELLKESIGQLRESQKSLTADIQALTLNVSELTGTVGTMQTEMRDGFDETREAINNLILANEATRKLAEEVAILAMNTSRRVTKLEEKE